MKRSRKYIVLVGAITCLGFAAFGLSRLGVFAASTPSLGAAASYGVLATTYTNTAAGTTINGDVGFTIGPTVEPDPVGGHTHYGSGAPYATAGTDQASALTALNAQGCTTTFPAAVDLFLDATHGTAGVYNPGVYCSAGAMSASGSITLSGSGTYIFRSVGALSTTASIAVNLSAGASACDVFWTPSGDTTLGASTAFKGTVIQNGDITIGASTVWQGRALAFSGAITSGALSNITVPTCTPPPATLHVIKQVVNNSGGSAVASSFNLHVELSGTDVAGSPAAGAVAPGTPYSLAAGTYAVSEDANVAYAQSFSGDCDSGGSVTLASGEDKTCTITNDDRPGSITVVKTVINNNGGTKVVADFPLFVGGTSVTSGVSNTFSAPGSYTVTETTDPNYTQTFSGACDSTGHVNLSPGDSKTCVVTNNDVAPRLHIIKQVVNDSGGTAITSDFSLHVKSAGVDVSGSPAPGAASPGTPYLLSVGTYSISEDASTGYSATFSGDCNSSGNITLALGVDKTCVVTNNDLPATITVVNVVINDNGRTKSIADFPLFVGGMSVVSGATNTFSAPGSYTISETTDSNYTQTFSGDCNSSGQLSLSLGDAKICTITNDDIGAPIIIPPVPPLITVVKVPSPLVLAGGPGVVTYTYTFHNIGTVTATNITMADDSCAPVTYISGDTNADARLEISETWIYTCTTTLAATHTNNVVVTGFANGISTTDIARATVAVSSTAIPPLIHVTKIPNPITLLSQGGTVTYTEQITNPGTAALSNVALTDSTCAPLKYISGDTNHDSKLDSTERWIYTCSSTLVKTVTNTATASGEANGLRATDFALATVIVAAAFPGFPNTGFGIERGSTRAVIILIIAVILYLFFLIRKKRLQR